MAGPGKIRSLTLYANGGRLPDQTTSVTTNWYEGQATPKCAFYICSRAGYVFKGYGTNPDGPVEVFEDENFPDVSATYYAIWEDLEVKFTLHANNGAFSDNSTEKIFSVTNHAGSTISSIVGEPTKNGFRFKGWSSTADGAVEYPSDYIVPSDFEIKNLYAVWEDLLGQISLNSEVLIETTSDATAKAEEISEGKTAYVKGQKLTGTMKKRFPNGTEWTQSNITDEIFLDVYYADGVWVTGSSGGLRYSADGKTWIQSNIAKIKIGTCYKANGIWVTGTDGFTSKNSGGLYYSTDGKTWIQSNIANDSEAFKCIHNANGIWVTGSNKGICYSTDGKYWTRSNITSDYIYSVCYANGIWVTGSNKGIYYSTDGKYWTRSNITSSYTYSVCYANGIWVTQIDPTEDNPSYTYYSTDGKTWTQSNLPKGAVNKLCYANGIWVAGMGYENTTAYYSTDGKTWARSNITTDNDRTSALYYANGIWVIGFNTNLSYKASLYYSTDGKTWIQSNLSNINVREIHNSNGIWLARSYSEIYYSADGKTWTLSNAQLSDLNSMYYANGIWQCSTWNGIYYSVGWEPSE